MKWGWRAKQEPDHAEFADHHKKLDFSLRAMGSQRRALTMNRYVLI